MMPRPLPRQVIAKSHYFLTQSAEAVENTNFKCPRYCIKLFNGKALTLEI